LFSKDVKFEKEIAESLSDMACLFHGNLAYSELIKRVRTTSDRQKIEDCVAYLSAAIKYVLFDAEATKRERDFLRKKGNE